jgi:rare lipoprotein A
MKLILFIFFSCLSFSTISQTSSVSFEENDEKKKDKDEKNIKKSKTLYGIASFYADKFEGRQTATGAIYSHNKLTAACNVLPLRTWIKVTNLRNNKSVIVQVNDRLHPKNKRIVDMSRMAAGQLGYIGRGLTQVKVEVLNIKKAKK